MRTAVFTVMALTLVAQPAFGGIGVPGKTDKSKYALVRVVNASELGVEVSINGGSFLPLEPGGTVERSFYAPSKSEGTVVARLLGSPEISGSGSGTLQGDKTTVVNVTATSSSVAVSFAKPGQAARLAREAGVALASTGGLLPLLWLGLLLGRRPGRRSAAPAKP